MSIYILGYGPITAHLSKALSPSYEVSVYSEILQRKDLPVLSYSTLIPLEFDSDDIIVLAWRGLPPSDSPKEKILKILSEKMTKDHRLINLSSVAVYGNTASPASEDHPISTINSYGAGKKALEEYCDRNLNTNICHLRISNVFGDIAFDDIVNRMLLSQKDRKTLPIAEPAKISRDFISIETLVFAIKQVIGDAHNLQNREVLNVSSGESISLQTLIEMVRDNNNVPLNYIETTTLKSNVQTSLISNEKIRSLYSLLQFSELSTLKNYIGNFLIENY